MRAPISSRLIGRDGAAASLLAAACNGEVVVITGRAGIGKSRLVDELRRAVTVSVPGTQVLVGRSPADGHVWPFGPLREALLGSARLGWRPPPELASYVPVLAALVPEWGEATPGTPDPALLGEAVLRLLTSHAADGPVVLVVEDVHWCDAESLAVLDYLTSNLDGSDLSVVLTCRDDERTPGAHFAAEILRRRIATELELVGLTAAQVTELAEECAGEPVPDELASVLVDRVAGVPLFVEELVSGVRTSGWDLVGSAVPGSILGSVAARLGDIEQAERALVIASALLGREFDWRRAATAVGLDDRTASNALRAATDAGLIEFDDRGYRFRHVLVRDAVVSVSPVSERAQLAPRLVDELVLTQKPWMRTIVSGASGLAACTAARLRSVIRGAVAVVFLVLIGVAPSCLPAACPSA